MYTLIQTRQSSIARRRVTAALGGCLHYSSLNLLCKTLFRATFCRICLLTEGSHLAYTLIGRRGSGGLSCLRRRTSTA
jgi:hypothetical protein